MDMSTKLIMERWVEMQNGAPTEDPLVISSGGIFVPRPPKMDPKGPLFYVLNVATENQTSKIFGAWIRRNLLDEAIIKVQMN